MGVIYTFIFYPQIFRLKIKLLLNFQGRFFVTNVEKNVHTTERREDSKIHSKLQLLLSYYL